MHHAKLIAISNSRDLTREELIKSLEYDELTGNFSWKIKRNNFIRNKTHAGHDHHSGYVHITLNFHTYTAHRLAWLYVYGVWPKNCIDHIDRNKKNNSIKNLRESTRSQNSFNIGNRSDNKSGHKGVTFVRELNKFRARCTINKCIYHLGYFNTAKEASVKYVEFSKIHHGIFSINN